MSPACNSTDERLDLVIQLLTTLIAALEKPERDAAAERSREIQAFMREPVRKKTR